MNTKILGLLAVALFSGPMAANAQVTTLLYQGDVISGDSSYLPTGFTGDTGGAFSALPTSPFVGSFTASITVDGSVSADNLSLVAANFNFNGSNFVGGSGASFSIGLLQEPPLGYISGPDICYSGGCIDLTTSNTGAITGASININDSQYYHAPYEQYVIGPGGDSITYLYATSNGTCQDFSPGGFNPFAPYTGPTVNPCSLGGSNQTAGTWIATTAYVPEIDPASAASGLTLLLGSLVVLRGRQRVR